MFIHFIVIVCADAAQRALGDTSWVPRAEWTARSQLWVCAALPWLRVLLWDPPQDGQAELLHSTRSGPGIRWRGTKRLAGQDDRKTLYLKILRFLLWKAFQEQCYQKQNMMGDLRQGVDVGEVLGGAAHTPVPVLSWKKRPLAKGQMTIAGCCTAWLPNAAWIQPHP